MFKDNQVLRQEINKVEKNYGECSLTIEEVLAIPTFKGYQVVAGHQGLSRNCKHITIMETPDGIDWLKGEEFILSAGYALKDDKNALKNIMYRIYKQKVSAIAFKEKRYIEEILPEMIDQANEYGIPLIKLPYNLGYTEAVSDFYEALFYKKNVYLLQLKNTHERLLNLMFEKRDTKGVVDALSALTGSSIIVYDSAFNLLSWNTYDSNHKEICRKIIEEGGLLRDVGWMIEQGPDVKFENYFINFYPILSNDKTIGYIYIIGDYILDNLNRTAIDRGRMILSLKMVKEENEFLNIIKIKKAITEIILNGTNISDEFYFNIINSYGWKVKERFMGMSIKIHDPDNNLERIEDIKEQFYNLISRIFNEEGFLVHEASDKIFLFYSIEKVISVNTLADKLLLFCRYYNKDIKLSFAVSRIYKQVRDIPRMYDECCITSLFSKIGNVMHYDSLDTVKLLYPLKEDKQVLEHYSNTIKKIAEYDTKNGCELLNTLEAYFQYNMNKKEVAEKMHIHIETLRYRLNKIESITGYSLGTSEGIFILQMNFKLHKMIGVS